MARQRPKSYARAVAGVPAVLRFWNRRITVMRGTDANEYGDESDVGVPLYTGVQAAIAETSQQVFDSATQRQQIIRTVTCQVPNWADIRTTDTILDESTGLYYMVESIQAEPGLGYYPPPKTLTLQARSGVSTSSD